MKIIVLVPEPEKRPPKKGDTFATFYNEIVTDGENYRHSDEPRQCFTRREVEVPEGATELSYMLYKDNFPVTSMATIPLPKPKKKIKKWCFLYKLGNEYHVTSGHYRNVFEPKEFLDSHAEVIRPIEESMIEVEDE